jgi:Domain of unknown function (DUF4402)
MMARTAFFGLGLVVAASLAAVPSARAQCRLCGTPTTAPDVGGAGASIDLQIEAALDFDRLVVLGPGEGSATLRPDGSRQVSGSVEAISGRAMVGEARVRGEPGRNVRIDMPSRIALHSLGGATISIDEIVTDLPPAPRLDSAGNLSFRFGGRLKLSGNSDGDFRGELPITVEYL